VLISQGVVNKSLSRSSPLAPLAHPGDPGKRDVKWLCAGVSLIFISHPRISELYMFV